MKKIVRVGLLVFSLLCTVLIGSAHANAATKDMYRLYNPNSGEHFYTANPKERDNVRKAGWIYEGIGWYAPDSGDPVYRLYNPNAGDHHYTKDSKERDHLKKVGWRYEGVGWYSDKKKTIPLYRAYNPNAKAGSHNYTVNKAEQNNLIRVGWRNEGIAWYGVNKGASKPSTPAVKKNDLQTLYNKVKGTAKGTYTATTWKTFQDALKNSKAVLENKNASQVQVNKAKDTLQKAFSGLKKESVPTVNTTALQALYSKVKGTAKGTYTAGTWKIFQDALKNAKTTLDNKKATQAQVNNAKDSLQKAFDGLKKETPPEIQKYTITVKYVDTDKKELKKVEVAQVSKGESYTAIAPDIEGYLLQGDKNKKLTNITASQEILFIYKKKDSGPDKEKVAFSGHVYNSSDQLLKDKEIVLSSSQYKSETIKTDEYGYFFVHLVLGETYTLNGQDFEVTLTAKSLDDIQVNNRRGKVTVGKFLSDPKQGQMNLKQSVVYVNEKNYSVSANYDQVEIPGKELLLTGDTIVLPPTEKYIEGFSFKINSVAYVNGKTQLAVKPCEVTEIVEKVDFSDTIDLSEMIFIPAEGVTPQASNTKRSDGGFSHKYNKKIPMGSSNGNIAIEFKGSIIPIWKYDALMPLNSQVGLAPQITTTLSADFNLKGKASTTVPVGKFAVISPVGVSVSVEVAFYISAEGEVKIHYSLSNTQNIEAGINNMQIYHDVKPSKTKETFSVDGKLSFKAAPQVSAGFGAFGGDAFKLNAQGGVDAGVTANYQAERNRIHFTGKAHLYIYAGFSMPIFSALPNDWSDEREIFQQRFPFTDDIDFELPIDPSKPIIPPTKPEFPKGEEEELVKKGYIPLTEKYFPDENFRNALKYAKPGNIQKNVIDINQVDHLDVSKANISDLTGIEYFKDLTYLKCIQNNLTLLDIESLNVQIVECFSNKLIELKCNPKTIEFINCANNKLSSLDVSMYTKLSNLDCSNNGLVSLDVSSQKNLTHLSVAQNNLETIQLKNNPYLMEVNLSENKIANFDFSGNLDIRTLDVSSNKINQLNVSTLTKLEYLVCQNNALNTFNFSNKALHFLDLTKNNISHIDTKNLPSLKTLQVSKNGLVDLKVAGSTLLEYLNCSYNNLVNLDVSQCSKLYDLFGRNNQFGLGSLKLPSSVEELNLDENQLKELDVSHITNLRGFYCQNNQLVKLDVSNNLNLEYVYCDEQATGFQLIGWPR